MAAEPVPQGRRSSLSLVKSDPWEMRQRWKASRKQLLGTWDQLLAERYTWDAHWREIGEFLLPRVPRFFVTDRNKGKKRHGNIYNETATAALKVGASGMMAGASPRSKPWFAVTIDDPDLADWHPVKLWLEAVEKRIRKAFEDSNTYAALHGMYKTWFGFGTACSVVLPDDEHALWHYPSPIGAFACATDYKGRIATLYRRYSMTVREMVDQFGIDNCSEVVRRNFGDGKLEVMCEVVNAIERRKDRDPSLRDNLNMPWRSVWFEVACSTNEDQVLRESGFSHFPAIVPRFEVDGLDTYGGCPGMDALGSIKGLQLREIALANGIEMQVKPVLNVPTAYKGRRVNMLPGGENFVDQTGPSMGITPAWQVQLNLQHSAIDIQRVEARINECFLKTMFQIISSSSDTTQRTAEEIAERRDEKLTIIGPAYMRLQDEALAPMVGLAYSSLAERGEIPPPPEELDGHVLKVDFVSALAQALKLSGLAGSDRFMQRIAVVGQFAPEVYDRLDADKYVDSMAGVLVEPSIIRSTEQAKTLREARGRMMAAQAQAAQMAQMGKTAKDLAAAPIGGERTALTDFNKAAAAVSNYGG